MSNLLARLERELVKDEALVDAILSRPDLFPPPPPEPARVLIQCDRSQVDRAIHRGLELANLNKETAHLEMIGDFDGDAAVSPN